MPAGKNGAAREAARARLAELAGAELTRVAAPRR